MRIISKFYTGRDNYPLPFTKHGLFYGSTPRDKLKSFKTVDIYIRIISNNDSPTLPIFILLSLTEEAYKG